MEKKFCRLTVVTEYEYFIYEDKENSKQEALEWLKSFEKDAQLIDVDGETRLFSRRCGNCVFLTNPLVLLRPKNCDEFRSISLKDFEKYQLLPLYEKGE